MISNNNKAQERFFQNIARINKIKRICKFGFLGNSNLKKKNEHIFLGKSFIGAILIILCIVSGFFLSKQIVSADNFYPSGDSYNCQFAQGTSMSISSLPNDIYYDNTQIRGLYSADITNFTMHNIANLSWPNAHRYSGVGDNLSLPPNSKFDVNYYYYNYAGHDVFLSDSYLFFSGSNGDLTKLINSENGSEILDQQIDFNLWGSNILKSGRAVSKSLNLNVENSNWNNAPRNINLFTFSIKDPVLISNPQVNYRFNSNAELIVELSIHVENISEYNLDNLELSYVYDRFNVHEMLSLAPKQSKTIVLTLNYGRQALSNITFSNIQFYNRTTQKECILQGVALGFISSNPDTRMLFTKRNDHNSPVGWSGIQEDFAFSPEGEKYCITRIPYRKAISVDKISIPEDVTFLSTLSSNTIANSNDLDLTCESNFKSKLSIRNNSVYVSKSTLEVFYNSSETLPIDTCNGIIIEEVINISGVIYDKKLRWNIDELNNSELWDCELTWKILAYEINSMTKLTNSFSIYNRFCTENGNCREITNIINIDSTDCLEVYPENSVYVAFPNSEIIVNIFLNNNIESDYSVSSYCYSTDVLNRKDCISGSLNIPQGVLNIDHLQTVGSNLANEILIEEICFEFYLGEQRYKEFCINISILPQPNINGFIPINFLNETTHSLEEIKSNPNLNITDSKYDFLEVVMGDFKNDASINALEDTLVNTGINLLLIIIIGIALMLLNLLFYQYIIKE